MIPAVTRPVSNAEINRELALLRRIFSLAVQADLLTRKPHVPMLQEAAPRSGFFEAAQLAAVLAHLPAEIQPVIAFAAITGWRIVSEVLPLEWRQLDLDAVDAGTTKNGEGRVFPCTADLRTLLLARRAERDRLQRAGHIMPWVFFRKVADGRGGAKTPQPIVSFTKAWRAACRAAGCPGKIPHDLRRTAIRTLVRAGVPESVAMELSGHKTRSSSSATTSPRRATCGTPPRGSTRRGLITKRSQCGARAAIAGSDPAELLRSFLRHR